MRTRCTLWGITVQKHECKCLWHQHQPVSISPLPEPKHPVIAESGTLRTPTRVATPHPCSRPNSPPELNTRGGSISPQIQAGNSPPFTPTRSRRSPRVLPETSHVLPRPQVLRLSSWAAYFRTSLRCPRVSSGFEAVALGYVFFFSWCWKGVAES